MMIIDILNKVSLRVLALVAAFVALAACVDPYEEDYRISAKHPELTRPGNATLASTPNKRQVFVAFSFGYNNLSFDLKEDIEDMISNNVPEYGTTENVVLVLSQNTHKNTSDYSTPTVPVLTHIYTRSGELVRDTLKVYADTTVAARKSIVEDVLTIAKERFPAQSYGMLMSSHGTGWAPQGYCYNPPDKTSGSIFGLYSGSYDGPEKYHDARPLLKSIGSHYNGGASRSIEIEIKDLADAIPMHIDYILFDACFMGCIEVAYELKDKCDMMCFSQTEILANGMDYKNLLSALFAEGGPDLTMCAENYFDMYKNQTGYMRSATISVVDCRKLDKLTQVVANHSQTIADLASNSFKRQNVQRYFQSRYSKNHGIFYDLESIFQEAGVSEETMNQLQTALSDCVICKYATPSFLSSFDIKTHSGLSMYLPDSDRYILNDFYKTLTWNKATNIIK